MNITQDLKEGLEVQNIDLNYHNVPFNIYLKNTGDILRLCFLERENEYSIIVSETTAKGTEEIRIIPKANIEYIGLFYDFTSLEPRTQDKMII